VIRFKQEWGDRAPVIIVPTKYHRTPTEVFREHGFSAVIWATISCVAALPPCNRRPQIFRIGR